MKNVKNRKRFDSFTGRRTKVYELPEWESINIDVRQHKSTWLAIFHDYSEYNRLLHVELLKNTATGMPQQSPLPALTNQEEFVDLQLIFRCHAARS